MAESWCAVSPCANGRGTQPLFDTFATHPMKDHHRIKCTIELCNVHCMGLWLRCISCLGLASKISWKR